MFKKYSYEVSAFVRFVIIFSVWIENLFMWYNLNCFVVYHEETHYFLLNKFYVYVFFYSSCMMTNYYHILSISLLVCLLMFRIYWNSFNIILWKGKGRKESIVHIKLAIKSIISSWVLCESCLQGIQIWFLNLLPFQKLNIKLCI